MRPSLFRSAITLLALAMAAGLVGCNSDNPTVGGDVTLVDGGPQDGASLDVPDPDDTAATDAGGDTASTTCTNSRECAGGELCVDGTCVPFCFADDDCPDTAPVCDPATSSCVGCLDDTNCAEGQICDSGACVDGCESSADCSGGEICRDGTCMPFCSTDADCGDDELCEASVCVPIGDETCTDSSDCPGGFTCLGELCVPIGGDCDGGTEECLGVRTGRTCVEGTWEPFSCSASEACHEGACVPAGGGDTCDSPGELTCGGDTIIVCGADGRVAATIDCASGQECEDGECVERVCDDSDNFCISERIIARCNPTTNVFFEEECHPQLACIEGACAFADGENVCGGDEVLPTLPGDACGDCGTIECDPADGNVPACDDPGLNECNGCGPIEVEFGTECGDCGVWACGDAGVICDDPGLNGCGWCGDLEGEPGDECGACGVWECNPGGFLNPRGVRCNDPGANACGGCEELPTFPGDLCEGGPEVHVCDGDDGLACERNLTDSCFTAIECNIFAARFGIVDPLSLACDGDVGCYLKGNCSPDGIPTPADPFGSACVGGSDCAVVPVIGLQVCTGCTVGDASTCRRGEECRDLFGWVTYCADPLISFP